VVHGRRSGLAWGLSEVQRERDACASLVGRAKRRGGVRGGLSRALPGQGRGKRESTREVDLWGGVAYWVQIPAWLVVERKGERFEKIFARSWYAMALVPLLLLYFRNSDLGTRVVLGVVLVYLLSMRAGF
jgi:hypothetical protein